MKGELTFMDKLQEILGKVSIKLSGNLYINAIKDGMLAYMPFAFIASIFLIIAFFPIPAFTDFVSSITGLEAAVWQGKLALVNDASLGIGGLLVLLSISRSLADKLGIPPQRVRKAYPRLSELPFDSDRKNDFCGGIYVTCTIWC